MQGVGVRGADSTPGPAGPGLVLVVDDDDRARRLVRMGLELEGAAVIEAESLQRARSVLHAGITGVVLDRQLPDGDGLDLLAAIRDLAPAAVVVIHSTLHDGREPSWAARVDKGDLPAIVDALDLDALDRPAPPRPLAVVDLVRAEAEEVARDWEELCRWDPLLPPDTSPPIARLVVDAVADALERPQPLGWGPDPALASVTEMFAASAGTIDMAVGQLICLREAFRRHVGGHVPPEEEAETQARVDMILDRAIWTASRVTAARLERRWQVDPLTGLANRAGFDTGLERELSRAARYARPLSVVVAELPSAATNDGADSTTADVEAQVRRVASVLATNVRGQDLVCRIGPARFAIVAPETDGAGAQAMIRRLDQVPMPAVRLGWATVGADGADGTTLLCEAERRLTRPA
ncbi:MAG TPA: response regulator [Acidimicrobiales bacterium]|nr:response regulator [Acidimicrobiales bacterium]